MEKLKSYITGNVNKPTTSVDDNKYLGKVNVTYMAKVDGKWLPAVVNFNNKDYNGYAGISNKGITAIAIKVNKGSIKYRVNLKGKEWLPWVTGYNTNDFYDGYAGDGVSKIDAVQIYYKTPEGHKYQQVWYRSQTVKRKGYLDVCCDDGSSVKRYRGYAGIYGESMDKIQISISSSNPF